MANLEKQVLYEYVAIWHPTVDEAKEGKKSIMVLPMTQFLAKEEKAVFMHVVKQLPAEWNDKLDQIDIVIRSF